ncbi:MAG: LON peptidase substrate-binding domain-containing protein [Aquiluna sp.]|nr:LON peptidase substrate-binding domain-containing protein [Aquiluna sp.]
MAAMPMFPLGLVLFPSMPLDLRIFEERYLKLLGDLMTSDKPEFGVVHNGRGDDQRGSEDLLMVGTIASVTDIGTTEEFYGLESIGTQRFVVNAWLPDDPYPLADVDFLPELTWDEGLEGLKDELEQSVRKLLAFASEFADLQYGPDIDISDDPIEACWQLAGVLPVGYLDQMDMLKSKSAEELLIQTRQITLGAEQGLLELIRQQSESDSES